MLQCGGEGRVQVPATLAARGVWLRYAGVPGRLPHPAPCLGGHPATLRPETQGVETGAESWTVDPIRTQTRTIYKHQLQTSTLRQKWVG
jgi:hypothetical protein